ncbi:hypothetical protein Tco_1252842 [Tanacetum coccineum]
MDLVDLSNKKNIQTNIIMEEVQATHEVTRAKIDESNSKYKADADKYCRVNLFNEGDEVMTLGGRRGEFFWEEGDDFRVDVLRFRTCLTDILGFLEKLEWWFEQDIDDEREEDEEEEDAKDGLAKQECQLEGIGRGSKIQKKRQT